MASAAVVGMDGEVLRGDHALSYGVGEGAQWANCSHDSPVIDGYEDGAV